MFGLVPRESAEGPQQIFGRGEQEARQEWDELGEGYTEEDQAEREEYFESIQKERENPAIQLTAEELEAAKNEPDEGTGFDIPEIRAARVRRDNAPQNTDEIKTQEREALRGRLADESYNADIENRQRNRQAWIVLGPPGAGKTTAIIAELKREQGALEIDSDTVKEGLPEYEGGVNAQGVHRESADIIEQRVLPRAIKAGDNIAIPRVGTRDDTVTKLISDLKADGYTTHLVLVNLSPIKAAGRVTVRFLRRGRFVDPSYARGVGTKPAEVYARLKNDPGIATFKSMDADVPLGRSPRTIEDGSNESHEERDIRLRRGDGGGIRGSSSVEGEGGQGTGRGRGPEGEAQPDIPLKGRHPLAPTAQVSEQLPSAGTFQEGTATEAPKSTKIVRDLQEVLHKQLEGVKVVEGRIPKRGIFARALAVVDPRAQVVRSVSMSDVPAIGHEYGHLMQKLLLGSSAEGGIDNAQLATLPGAVRGELQDLGKGISDESLTEGWAEFWRRYLDNPSALDAEASNARTHIEELLEQHPAVENAWTEAREQWKLHRDASPQARLRSHISIGESDPDLLSIGDKWMRFRTNMLDDFEPIRKVVEHVRQRTGEPLKLEEDAETLARLSRGATGIGDMFVGEKKGDRWVGGTVDFGTLDRTGKSLGEILEPVQERLDDFRDYMVARRAQELHKRDILTGIRDQDAAWTVKTLEERYGDDFKPAFKALQEYNDSLLDFLGDSGVISQESLAAIRKVNENYVPFNRVKENAKGPGGGAGLGTLWSPVKRLKGSGRDIVDPLESILKNTYNYVALAQKQQVSTALANLASKEGVGDLFEQLLTPMRPQQFTVGEVSKDLKEAIPGFDQLIEQLESVGVDPSEELLAVFRPGDYMGKVNTISVLKDGKRQWFEVDPELYKALEGLETEQLDAWVRMLGKPVKTLRAGATLDPAFMIRNPLRDQVMAFIQSEYGYKPFWDFGRGVFEMVRKGQMYEDFMVSGATQSTLLGLDRDSQQRNLNELTVRQVSVR